LVAQGLGNKAITNRLHVSEVIVKTHLVHVSTKLNVDTSTAAVNVAVDRGLNRLNRRHPLEEMIRRNQSVRVASTESVRT
jgi:hypothetical protein